MNRILLCIGCAFVLAVAAPQEAPKEIAKMNHVHFFGGPGDTRETSVVIEGAKSQKQGMEAEYFFIGRSYGKKDKAWKIAGQSLERDQNKVFDMLEIEQIPSGTHLFFYFDLTQCSWAASKTPASR